MKNFYLVASLLNSKEHNSQSIKKLAYILSSFMLLACHSKKQKVFHGSEVQATAPATVTTIAHSPLVDYAEFKAISAYTKIYPVKAPTSGKVNEIFTQTNKLVQDDQVLFNIRIIENDTGRLIIVKSPIAGIMKEIRVKVGSLVDRNERLATIADANSFGFRFVSPDAIGPNIYAGKSVQIILEDGNQVNGFISVEKTKDSSFLIAKMSGFYSIPEGRQATVRVIRAQKSNAASLPVSAVLNDSLQNVFWVMKMIDNNTAVKVPVTVGMQTADRIEILTPAFSDNDEILLTGNSGLPDTAIVTVAR